LNLEPDQLIYDLRHGRSDTLDLVYTAYREDFIHWMMTHNACGIEEARDIYQQCIIIFYENIVSGKLTTLTSSLKTYLYGIGKNKLRELTRGKQKERSLNAADFETSQQYDEAMLQQVETCVENLGEPCRSMLIEFYYHKRSIDELKAKFGYKNIESAKNQKYKCLERLRKMVREYQLSAAP
jgi:RNA polymerase sigma factor (sigma-70 family)